MVYFKNKTVIYISNNYIEQLNLLGSEWVNKIGESFSCLSAESDSESFAISTKKEMKMEELKYELIGDLTANLGDPLNIGSTPKGERVIYPVVSGKLIGNNIMADIVAESADWMLILDGGLRMIDVRLTAKTKDNELIYIWYPGILYIPASVMERFERNEQVDSSDYYFRITPQFETSSKKFEWLNNSIFVGIGTLGLNCVSYKIYRIL